MKNKNIPWIVGFKNYCQIDTFIDTWDGWDNNFKLNKKYIIERQFDNDIKKYNNHFRAYELAKKKYNKNRILDKI